MAATSSAEAANYSASGEALHQDPTGTILSLIVIALSIFAAGLLVLVVYLCLTIKKLRKQSKDHEFNLSSSSSTIHNDSDESSDGGGHSGGSGGGSRHKLSILIAGRRKSAVNKMRAYEDDILPVPPLSSGGQAAGSGDISRAGSLDLSFEFSKRSTIHENDRYHSSSFLSVSGQHPQQQHHEGRAESSASVNTFGGRGGGSESADNGWAIRKVKSMERLHELTCEIATTPTREKENPFGDGKSQEVVNPFDTRPNTREGPITSKAKDEDSDDCQSPHGTKMKTDVVLDDAPPLPSQANADQPKISSASSTKPESINDDDDALELIIPKRNSDIKLTMPTNRTPRRQFSPPANKELFSKKIREAYANRSNSSSTTTSSTTSSSRNTSSGTDFSEHLASALANHRHSDSLLVPPHARAAIATQPSASQGGSDINPETPSSSQVVGAVSKQEQVLDGRSAMTESVVHEVNKAVSGADGVTEEVLGREKPSQDITGKFTRQKSEGSKVAEKPAKREGGRAPSSSASGQIGNLTPIEEAADSRGGL